MATTEKNFVRLYGKGYWENGEWCNEPNQSFCDECGPKELKNGWEEYGDKPESWTCDICGHECEQLKEGK